MEQLALEVGHHLVPYEVAPLTARPAITVNSETIAERFSFFLQHPHCLILMSACDVGDDWFHDTLVATGCSVRFARGLYSATGHMYFPLLLITRGDHPLQRPDDWSDD